MELMNYNKEIEEKYGIHLGDYGITCVVKEGEEENTNRYLRYLVAADCAEMCLGGYYFEFDHAKDAVDCVAKLREKGVDVPMDSYERNQKELMDKYHLTALPDDVVYVITKKEHGALGCVLTESGIYKKRGYFGFDDFVICTKNPECVSKCAKTLMEAMLENAEGNVASVSSAFWSIDQA